MYSSKTDYVNFVDYLVLILIVGVSSFPILVGDLILIISGILTAIIFFYRKYSIDKSFINYLLFFLILFLISTIKFGIIDIPIVLGFSFRLLFGYMAFKLLHNKFVDIYINLIYIFALISLFFYFTINLFPSFENFLLTHIVPIFEKLQVSEINRKHIGIYTIIERSSYEYFGLKRNSGPFWEPGGFGVYLNLALLFYILKNKKVWTFKFFVLITALITTLSTGAIFVFALIVSLLINIKVAKILPKIIFGLLLLIYSFWSFNHYSFLGQKFEMDIVAGERGIHTRTGSVLADKKRIFENPFFGTSLYKSSRFTQLELSDADLLHRNNGTSNLLTSFGLIGFIIYFYRMKKQVTLGILYNYFNSKQINIYITLIIIISLGLTQNIFFKPFFLGLSAFFPVLINSKKSYVD